jgi:hypothetical protein
MADAMLIDHRAKLKQITSFDSLVGYLRDEMDWPIDGDKLEDLSFEYTAEELGIDPASAAKIQEIQRLRPLSVGQPWGIFFVRFEPRRLPVVALRRILSRVVLKKRASANSAERTAWEAEDLLFVSNFGDGADRQICFAHFTLDEQKSDLPTLKVLGWNDLDTPLRLDHVADTLTERLAWPDDERDIEAWRGRWRSAFTLRHREVITTSKILAERLAGLARAIRNRTNMVLSIETGYGPVPPSLRRAAAKVWTGPSRADARRGVGRGDPRAAGREPVPRRGLPQDLGTPALRRRAHLQAPCPAPDPRAWSPGAGPGRTAARPQSP